MESFWGSDTWGTYNVVAVLLLSLLVANVLRKSIKWLNDSLIPTSVLGGGLLLIISAVYRWITDTDLFQTAFFGGAGIEKMKVITYHALALGFIASAFKSSQGKLSKQRTVEIFNTGVTTVSTYLLQAILGLGISILATFVVKEFFVAAGVLLPFGYGQGTGQAMNYGIIYETDFGFIGGKSFGLTIAALGFLCASIGGVIHLNILKKMGKLPAGSTAKEVFTAKDIQADDEIPMQESIDKLTIQVALIALAYILAYGLMFLLGQLLPGMKSVVYGFNFLLGVLAATVVKSVLGFLKNKKVIKKEYTNNFLMTRTSNFFFDIMVVAGIGAIRLSILEKYWGILLIMGAVGMVSTYAYNLFVAKKLFPAYAQEQFLAMYGMLTGTASTGIILLREVDGNFTTPVSDNLVYQNFPAIVFGFPMMLLATLAPVKPYLTLIIFVLFFAAMNIILFRSQLFRRRK